MRFPRRQFIVFVRVSQRDVVYLGCPIAPADMSPNAGVEGGGGVEGL